MVNVGRKTEAARSAIASARVILGQSAFQAVESNSIAKGDVLSVARVAGILAAKQTASLIPLCHSIPLDRYLPAAESPVGTSLLMTNAIYFQEDFYQDSKLAGWLCKLCDQQIAILHAWRKSIGVT